jgi:hypothetical protein
MTEALASKTCTPCRGGIPPLTREQAELFHAQAPDWQLAEEAHRIERSFRHHRIPTNQSADFSDGPLRLAQFD